MTHALSPGSPGVLAERAKGREEDEAWTDRLKTPLIGQ
jgi:hypothetical protein